MLNGFVPTPTVVLGVGLHLFDDSQNLKVVLNVLTKYGTDSPDVAGVIAIYDTSFAIAISTLLPPQSAFDGLLGTLGGAPINGILSVLYLGRWVLRSFFSPLARVNSGTNEFDPEIL